MKSKILKEFNIDSNRGFLPTIDPIIKLSDKFSEWDKLGKEMSSLLTNGDFRKAVLDLPDLDISTIEDGPELERAMLLLSMFANAFVWCGDKPKKIIPSSIAIPLHKIAARSGRPPITSHASIVLNNWKRIDTQKSLELENLKTIQNFLGGIDEDWFFLTAVAIEYAGAKALFASLIALEAASKRNYEEVYHNLDKVVLSMEKSVSILQRIPEKCAPEVFYFKIRPFLSGWPDKGVIYEGVSDDPMKFIGGSAAQSSLLQSIDLILGVSHNHPDSSPFLLEMRNYMPRKHRNFIKYLQSQIPLKNYIDNSGISELKEKLNLCFESLEAFRDKHMKIALKYIKRQGRDEKKYLGTGGTDFVSFLNRTKTETEKSKI